MLNLDAIKSRTESLIPVARDAALAATGTWRRFLSDEAGYALPFGARERANFLHAHFRRELTARVQGSANLRPTMRPGFFVLVVDGELLIRPKYCGRGAPANVATEQQQLLAAQFYTPELMEALSFEGVMEPPTLVTLGYTLAGAELSRLFILRECTGFAPQSFDIYGGSAMAEQKQLPGMPEPRAARVASKRARKPGAESVSEAK